MLVLFAGIGYNIPRTLCFQKDEFMRDKLFSDRDFLKRLFALTLPIAFQSLMLASVAAADAIMLGRIDQDAMSAVSLATQIQFVQNMILSSCTGTAAVLGAQYWGKGDKKTINDIFCMILRLCGLASFVFFALCTFIPEHLMAVFTNVPQLIEIGAGYLKIAGWSYLLTGISQCYIAIFKVTEHVPRAAWISSGAVVINIVLNAILIYGLLGVPAMGVAGAAIATLISRIIELGWCVVSSYSKGFLRPDFTRLFHHSRQLARDFAHVALPLLGASLLWGVGFTAYTAIIGHMGSDAAAACAISAVVRDLMCCLCNGLASGGGILVGYELGAGRLDYGKLYGIRLAKLAFLNGFSCTVLVLLIIPVLLPFMSLTEQAREYLIGMMVIMAVYMIGRCVNTIIINGVFASGGDTIFDVYSLIVAMWLFALPLAWLGAFKFGWSPVAVYACTCLDEVGKIPWVMIHFRKYKWVKNLTRENIE